MLVLICPACGTVNPLSGERCLKCETSLEGVLPTDSAEDSQPGGESLEILPRDEHDLPGLLQSLKKDGDIDEIETSSQDNSISDGKLDEIFAEEPEEEEIPGWLERIRKRAQEEPDAIGDITQKISAALGTIADDNREFKQDEFKSWIENLRKGGRKSSTEQSSDNSPKEDESKSMSSEDKDWLAKIRKAEGKIPEISEESREDPSDQKGDSLLQWLIELEDSREKLSNKKDEIPGITEDITEDTHPTTHPDKLVVSEPTQKIAVPKEDIVEIDRPIVDITPEEVEQSDLFKVTLDQEIEKAQQPEPKKKPLHWLWRLIISLVLMASLLVSMVFWDNAEIPANALSPQNQAIISLGEDLPTGSSLLLIFNFQPGYSSEMMRVAKPVMQILTENNPELSILSITPSGDLLANRLIAYLGEQDLVFTDLGYFPVSSLAAFGISNRAQSLTLQLPDVPLSISSEGYDGILLLSDQAEDVQAWVEQLTALQPDTPILLILTAKAGPMSLPYWESGQVSGMVSGVAEAAALSNAVSGTQSTSVGLRAYQVGSAMMMLMLVLGLFYGEGVLLKARGRRGNEFE